MLILCVDGIDPDLAAEHNLKMPYERKLTIPRELYITGPDNPGIPWTPHVWGSIFAGRIEVYPDFRTFKRSINPLRNYVRKYLLKNNIKWHRSGFTIKRAPIRDDTFRRIKPVITENVLDRYLSLDVHIPAISHDYFYGGDDSYRDAEYKMFLVLASMLQYSMMNLSAIYTRKIDIMGHRVTQEKGMDELLNYYDQVFAEANSLKGNIMLLSDHGCIESHTDHAYLGCTQPVYANSVLEVRKDIERIVDGEIARNAENV